MKQGILLLRNVLLIHIQDELKFNVPMEIIVHNEKQRQKLVRKENRKFKVLKHAWE